MNIDEQLKQILKFGEGNKFFSFANADGKRWIMPVRNMQTAMNLYQPSGPKGKLVKVGLPLLYWNPATLRVLHAERLHLSLTDEMRKLLEKNFGVKNPEFAIFCGTPSARQKITIQISHNKQILGYCKITQSPEIFELFKQEYKTLKALSAKSIPHIPTSLFCDAFANVFVFIQSTQKTNKSQVVHTWTDKHTVYLELLYQRTKTKLKFENTDFYLELQYLESVLEQQTHEARDIYQRAILILKMYYSKISEYSFFHGDFTPWNMFFEKGNLCVFDFEYAQMSFPPYLDKIHYILQVWIIEQKLNAEQIFTHLEILRLHNKIETIQLIAYLTHILAFYTKLYNGKFDPTDNGYIIWSTLLNKYVTIYEQTNT